MTICSLAARRAYAAGAVLAVFLIGGVVSGTFQAEAPGLETLAPFFNPLAILDGARQWLFGGAVAESPVGGADVPLITYGLAAALLLGVSLAILAVRYRRVTT
jgi:hypothetical protein